ncbi:unnamed protein product, partial [Nesidiocoris tenuis]
MKMLTCMPLQISFFYHKYGPHSGSLGLFLIELKSDTNDTIKLWWSYGTKESSWQKHVVTLPNNMTSRIVAKGASGGMGGDGQGISKGALVRSVMELKKGQSIYILVGQEGMQSCRKNFVKSAETVCHLEGKGKEKTRIGDIRNLKHLPEGGGGGGGSFVFL